MAARAVDAAYFEGQLGRARAFAIAAERAGEEAGDEPARLTGVLGTLYFASMCGGPAIESALNEAVARLEHNAWGQGHLFLRAVRASATAWARGSIDELEELSRRGDRTLSDMARLLLAWAVHQRDPGHAARLVDQSQHAVYACQPMAVAARLALARGEPAGALALAEQALSRTADLGWAREWSHATRIEALLLLDRPKTARDAAQSAIDRLARTLEGADEWMLARIGEGCAPIEELDRQVRAAGLELPPLGQRARSAG